MAASAFQRAEEVAADVATLTTRVESSSEWALTTSEKIASMLDKIVDRLIDAEARIAALEGSLDSESTAASQVACVVSALADRLEALESDRGEHELSIVDLQEQVATLEDAATNDRATVDLDPVLVAIRALYVLLPIEIEFFAASIQTRLRIEWRQRTSHNGGKTFIDAKIRAYGQGSAT